MSRASKLEKLIFSIGLMDKISAPLGKITRRLGSFEKQAKGAFLAVGMGIGGMMGANVGLDGLLNPGLDLNRALGEVSSLGVDDAVLEKLGQTSLKFTTQFGGDAAAITRAAYDIQSAIAGLEGAELSNFTYSSALLAKATKSDAGTITNFMGTMYGIFSDDANALGRTNWINRVTGMTAMAVQMFKTQGTEMSNAFSNLGADAKTNGIAMAEQYGVLGRLQASMSGGEAGTKYRAFLDGVGQAQKTLGLQFTDSHGRLLPMVEVLKKLEGKFGSIDKLAESDMLKKAFGSGEAVALIKLLGQDIGALESNIEQLSNVKGLDYALAMAEKMTDPFEQSAAGMKALHIQFSRALVKVFTPFASRAAEISTTLNRWATMFPNITKAIAVAAAAVLGLISGVAALSLITGIAKFMMIGLNTVTVILGGTWKLFSLVVRGGALALTFARNTALAFYMASQLMGGGLAFLRTGMMLFNASVWANTVALLANPLFWIPALMIAIGAAIVGLIVYWDEISAAAGRAGAWIMEKWQVLMDWFANLNPFEMFGQALDWLIDKINLIPGVNIETRFAEPKGQSTAVKAAEVPGINAANDAVFSPAAAVPAFADTPMSAPTSEGAQPLIVMPNQNTAEKNPGGLMQSLTNSAQTNTDNRTQIDQVIVNANDYKDAENFVESLRMMA